MTVRDTAAAAGNAKLWNVSWWRSGTAKRCQGQFPEAAPARAVAGRDELSLTPFSLRIPGTPQWLKLCTTTNPPLADSITPQLQGTAHA